MYFSTQLLVYIYICVQAYFITKIFSHIHYMYILSYIYIYICSHAVEKEKLEFSNLQAAKTWTVRRPFRSYRRFYRPVLFYFFIISITALNFCVLSAVNHIILTHKHTYTFVYIYSCYRVHVHVYLHINMSIPIRVYRVDRVYVYVQSVPKQIKRFKNGAVVCNPSRGT